MCLLLQYFCLCPPTSEDGGASYNADPEKRRKDYDAEGAKIEQRIKRERPCRVLFVRNVKVRPLYQFTSYFTDILVFASSIILIRLY